MDKAEEVAPVSESSCRHIVSLSGGKDSTALALYLRNRIPNLEYVFCDTGEELEETYEYLKRIEAKLGVSITRLNPERRFRHYLDVYKGVLPDPRTRWCTRMLKLKPLERYVGEDPVCLYVGIRADEPYRKGYVSTKPNIRPRFPFVDDGLRLDDVERILTESGLGRPAYYEWRSRSGCYFCFFQQRREWVGLLKRHPNLYWKAAEFEKTDATTGREFTWVQNESLRELAKPERVEEVLADYEGRRKAARALAPDTLKKRWTDEGEDDEGCVVCHL